MLKIIHKMRINETNAFPHMLAQILLKYNFSIKVINYVNLILSFYLCFNLSNSKLFYQISFYIKAVLISSEVTSLDVPRFMAFDTFGKITFIEMQYPSLFLK